MFPRPFKVWVYPKIKHLACERDILRPKKNLEASFVKFRDLRMSLSQAKRFILGYAHTLKGRFWANNHFGHFSRISLFADLWLIKKSNKIFLEDLVFGQSLSDLELNEDNMEEIIARCRQLQVETIRFTRWRQMDMLEDFIKSQNGSFETK